SQESRSGRNARRSRPHRARRFQPHRAIGVRRQPAGPRPDHAGRIPACARHRISRRSAGARQSNPRRAPEARSPPLDPRRRNGRIVPSHRKLQHQPVVARGILSAPPSWGAGVLAGVKHGFFGREGGVSSGIYASLNAGTGSNDDPANVLENRRRIAAAFGVERDHLTGVHQVHSPTAVFIDAPWKSERPRADALVTTTPRLAISILTADCTPILFADREA